MKSSTENGNPNKTNYRILNKDNTYYGVASQNNSWFTLTDARKICNRSTGQRIVEISMTTGEIMWECF